jgi:hypothetical protein
MRYNVLVWSALLVVFFASAVKAQVQQPQTGAPNAPLELPDFLVTGKAVVDIAGGAKQTPQKPFKLTTRDLDSLNPNEKFPSPLVPNRPLPEFKRKRSNHTGYVDVLYGSYVSPELAAGSEFLVGDYRIDAALDAGYSSEWVPNASILNAGLALSSSYVAPEKFYLFGKGLTETDILVRHNEYTLFADSLAPTRRTTRLSAAVATEALVGDVPVSANLHWNLHDVTDSGAATTSDNRIHGGLAGDFGRGYRGRVDLDLQSRSDDSYPFVEAAFSRTIGDTALKVQLTLGAQYATNTSGESRTGLLASASLEYENSAFMSYGVQVRSGLAPTRFSDVVLRNPFVSRDVLIDIPYDVVQVVAQMKYHPSQTLQFLGSLNARRTARLPVWTDAARSQFGISYLDATILQGSIEMHITPSSADRLLAVATVQSAILKDGATVPYYEPLRVDVSYSRQFSRDLRASVAMQYVGKRYVDIENTGQLDAFLNVRMQGSYAASSTLDVVFNADNLINSTIILWNGYRQRGIFVSGGVSWRL